MRHVLARPWHGAEIQTPELKELLCCWEPGAETPLCAAMEQGFLALHIAMSWAGSCL